LFTFRIGVFYLKIIIECIVVGRVLTVFDNVRFPSLIISFLRHKEILSYLLED
jgi:hypothetical protein